MSTKPSSSNFSTSQLDEPRLADAASAVDVCSAILDDRVGHLLLKGVVGAPADLLGLAHQPPVGPTALERRVRGPISEGDVVVEGVDRLCASSSPGAGSRTIPPMAPFDFRSRHQPLLDFEAWRVVRPEEAERLLGRNRLVWQAVVLDDMFDPLAFDAGDKEAVVDAAVELHRRKSHRHASVQLPHETVLRVERHSADQKHRAIRQRLRSAHEAPGVVRIRAPHVNSAFAVLVVGRVLHLPRIVVLSGPRSLHRQQHKLDLLSDLVVSVRSVLRRRPPA